MTKCVDDTRRMRYLNALFAHVEEQGYRVRKGGNFKFGFTLERWPPALDDDIRYPGCYIYCNSQADQQEHRDIVCFEVPNSWPFDGDDKVLRVARVPSLRRPKTHSFLILLTPNSELVDPQASPFKPEVGNQVLAIFRILERLEPTNTGQPVRPKV